MNDFLAKPINADELNRILRRWLPPEKIIDSKKSFRNEEDELAALFSELGTIEELDVGAGLSHIGENRSSYAAALRQLCTEMDHYPEDIRRFTANKDWKEYAILLHGLKGVFANIGVESLREWAYRLEMASKSNDNATCQAETEAFIGAMNQIRDKLRATFLYMPLL
jgi:HPt (histidine-containing phosphotransfer) domain-containing protein